MVKPIRGSDAAFERAVDAVTVATTALLATLPQPKTTHARGRAREGQAEVGAPHPVIELDVAPVIRRDSGAAVLAVLAAFAAFTQRRAVAIGKVIEA